jgi:hypothetical protein
MFWLLNWQNISVSMQEVANSKSPHSWIESSQALEYQPSAEKSSTSI